MVLTHHGDTEARRKTGHKTVTMLVRKYCNIEKGTISVRFFVFGIGRNLACVRRSACPRISCSGLCSSPCLRVSVVIFLILVAALRSSAEICGQWFLY